ncbi:MAG: molecular chaperone TorD family protein [Thermodesulfovibrionales bacterium]|jgi:TorA maturation chaperone TorD
MNLIDDDNYERASLYKLFSSLFMQKPSEEALVTMRGMFQMKFEETVSEIGKDFGYLFQEPAGHLPPYESLYSYSLGDRPRFWGKVTEEIQECYRSAGLIIDEEIHLIPDHISAELLFMSYLIERGLTDRQRSFLEDHLLAWIPEYCTELRKHAYTTFYREVAELLKNFVSSDYEEFESNGNQ